MSSELKIRKDGELDFLSLGALIHRLDPGIIPFRKATECKIHVSGGEFNVAANLSDCFRLKTAIVSAMVDYPIGDLIAERVRAMGVKPIYKHFKHDGVTGPNMATVYSDRATACVRPWCSTTAAMKLAQCSSRAILTGRRSLPEACAGCIAADCLRRCRTTTAALAAEMMREAKAAGAVTSFDLNYREKLWKIQGGNAKAVETIGKIVENVDVLVGNEEDLQKGLGIPGPEVHAKSKLDPTRLFRDDGPGDQEAAECKGCGDNAARGALDQQP